MDTTKLILISGFFCLNLLQACNKPPHNFTSEIAECKANKEVKLIGQGTFEKDKKGNRIFYYFQIDTLHFGNFHGVDRKTGKKFQMTKTPVTESEVPTGSLGKEALFCSGNGKIRAIHFAEP